MTREEAIERFNGIINAMSISIAQSKFYPSKAELNELCDMAIKALSEPSIVRCGECKHRYYADNRVPHERNWVCERFADEEVTDADFCSYGERREP